jgi:predicted aspartyl protease
MPVLLLLTILSAPAVPQSTLPLLAGARAGSLVAHTSSECRLRVGPGGIPVLRVDLGSGTHAWFVLDTGATGTTVHPDLVERLGLKVSGSVRITTAESSMPVATVRLATLGIGGQTLARDLDVAVHQLALVRRAVPEADGILGQDVLGRYDYLVDHDRQRLTIGRFAPPPRGVPLPLTWSAGRPVVMMAGAGRTSGLVLDTGTDVLVMEAGAARSAIGDIPPAARSRAVLQTHTGARQVDVEHHAALRVANVDLPAVSLVRLPSADWTMAPEVGLLPASLFSRIYVSARTGQAAVWPRR